MVLRSFLVCFQLGATYKYKNQYYFYKIYIHTLLTPFSRETQVDVVHTSDFHVELTAW